LRKARKTVYVPGCFGGPKDLGTSYALRYQAIRAARVTLRTAVHGYGYTEKWGSVETEDVRQLELDERDIAILVVPELAGGASVWLDRETGEFYCRESIVD
jgi:hypothetical protein